MLIVLQIMSFAAVKTLLVGLPESVGLLAFGIGLIATGTLLRRFLGRGDAEQTDEDLSNKALSK